MQMRDDELREVCHIERTGHRIEIADPQKVEGRANGPDEEVAEGRQHGFPPAQRDQRIAGKRHDLQIHIEVEYVAGDDHTGKADRQKTEERIVAAYVEPVLILHKRPAVERDEHGNEGDQHRKDAVQRVQRKFDADRRDPAAHHVVPGRSAIFKHMLEHQAGTRKGARDGSHHDVGAQIAADAGEKHAEKRAGQRQKYDKYGSVLCHLLALLSTSTSSTEP